VAAADFENVHRILAGHETAAFAALKQLVFGSLDEPSRFRLSPLPGRQEDVPSGGAPR
jgi:hypothetical protein